MYQLNDKQIDYILNDIRRRGIEMEDLQLNLLDHICCVIEAGLEKEGNFEAFYEKILPTFFKESLREIEDETITLLTFKHYYTMKKTMIVCGTIAATVLSAGIFFKFMHWPGAAMGIVLGTGLLSFVFLPLLFILKIREKQDTRDKILIGIGTLSGITICIAILFKLQHWPMANLLGMSALAMLGLLFLPFFFFTGIRKAETKVNTIISTIIIVTGCSLFLALVRSPGASRKLNIAETGFYFRNEQILKREREAVMISAAKETPFSNVIQLSNEIDRECEELKSMILESQTGKKKIEAGFEQSETFLGEAWIGGIIGDSREAMEKVNGISEKITALNQDSVVQSLNQKGKANTENTIGIIMDERIFHAMNHIIQLQMSVLQTENYLLSMN